MDIASGLPDGFDPRRYDMLVVGSGFAGAVCARRLAEISGFRVAVLERRDHVGGNAYDRYDGAGILCHRYGPHIYHTSSERVHGFLSRFTDWTDYQHRVLANVDGRLMPVPFNRRSMEIAFGSERAEHLFAKLVLAYGENRKVAIGRLRASDDPDLKAVADYVYENIFRRYTEKQWGAEPEDVDPSVIGRVPVVTGDDDRYFPGARHQGMPVRGYAALFSRMLDHDLIDVFCDVDARDLLTIGETNVEVCGHPYGGEIVYTGALDELFGYDLGQLPYRTLRLEFETLDEDWFQPVGTVNYTVSEDFTRITEFKHLTGQDVPGKTTICREYPGEFRPGRGQVRYYPVPGPANDELHRAYAERVESLSTFHPVGRLAEYRYYDMDAVVESALDLSDELIACHG